MTYLLFAAQPAEIGPVGRSVRVLINFLDGGRAAQLLKFAIIALPELFLAVDIWRRGKSSLSAGFIIQSSSIR